MGVLSSVENIHPSRNRTIHFGEYELDVRAGELRKQGVRIKLQEQPFQILQTLLERPGEVIHATSCAGRSGLRHIR